MDSHATKAIVTWAERQTKPTAHTPAYKRLTQEQLVALLDLRKLGKTQVEIAETLGCDQATVSRALHQFTDTTEPATAYLRGSALRMAKNVVRKGHARDHIAALKGIGVLEADRSDLNIAIGLSLPGLPGQSESQQIQAGIVVGADNQSYVNSTK